MPNHVRSDNGLEFVAQDVRDWIGAVGSKTAIIEPGRPWENGYVEPFNARLRDELLSGEIFYSLREAKIVIESWGHYNIVRLHASMGYKATRPGGAHPCFCCLAGCASLTCSALLCSALLCSALRASLKPYWGLFAAGLRVWLKPFYPGGGRTSAPG